MRRLHRLLMLPAIALALPASAEIYRWTDSSGDTHFGSNPPTGVNAEPVSTTRTNTIDTTSQQGDKERESADDSQDGQPEGEGEQSPEEQKKREEIRQQNCETARQALKTLEQNARVQVKEDGERRYLSPEEKAAELAV